MPEAKNPQQAQFDKMTRTPIPRLVMGLAVPTILSMLITSIYNLADTFFMGQISTSASGAVGVVSSLMAVIQAVGFMLGHGAGSVISRSLGSGDAPAASRFASTSFFTALGAGAALGVFGIAGLTPLMRLLGSTETILPHARAYAFYILLAAPFMMSSLVMNNILRYEGKASFAMVGLVTGGVLNMALDPVFIFGLGMGAGGAGLATGLSQMVSFGILLSMYLRGKTVSRLALRFYTRSPRDIATILTTGLPSFGRQGLASFASMMLNVAARPYGDAAVAAMSIVSRIFQFLLSVALGVGQGFQPVASYNYGARKFHRVRQACLFTIGASFVLMTALAAACYANGEALVRLFRDDGAVTAIALPAFRWQCAATLLQPVLVCGNMLFQSVGKAGRATFLSCCRQGIFFIPLILTLPRAFGLAGVQYSQPIADVLSFVVAVPFMAQFLAELDRMDAAEG